MLSQNVDLQAVDLVSLNSHILVVDTEKVLDGDFDQYLEMSLAAFFDIELSIGSGDDPITTGCGQLSCNGYWPIGHD